MVCDSPFTASPAARTRVSRTPHAPTRPRRPRQVAAYGLFVREISRAAGSRDSRRGPPPVARARAGSRDRQLTGKDVRFYLLGAGLSKDQAHRVWEQLDENGNGKVSYPERDTARKSKLLRKSTHLLMLRRFKAWTQDRLADVAVDDINYTTRSFVDVGAIQAKAQAKIGA